MHWGVGGKGESVRKGKTGRTGIERRELESVIRKRMVHLISLDHNDCCMDSVLDNPGLPIQPLPKP